MVNKNKPSGDYEVGYGKPPKSGQIKKGERRNPKGRPTKRNREQVDVAAVLNEPLVVKNSGIRQKMPAFEVGFRRLVERALKHKNLPAILEFLELCETYGLMVPPPVPQVGGVIHRVACDNGSLPVTRPAASRAKGREPRGFSGGRPGTAGVTLRTRTGWLCRQSRANPSPPNSL